MVGSISSRVVSGLVGVTCHRIPGKTSPSVPSELIPLQPSELTPTVTDIIEIGPQLVDAIICPVGVFPVLIQQTGPIACPIKTDDGGRDCRADGVEVDDPLQTIGIVIVARRSGSRLTSTKVFQLSLQRVRQGGP